MTKLALPGREGRGPLRCYERVCVSEFSSREEVVEACLASVHIPFFMDGRPLTRLTMAAGQQQQRRQLRRVLDGSFLMREEELLLPQGAGKGGGPVVVLDHSQDEELRREGGPADFVTLLSPDGVKALMRMGYQYARRRDRAGHFEPLRDSLRRRPPLGQ